MEVINKNGREFYRFKIGDEFEAKSSRNLFSESDNKDLYKGDITFNKLLKEKLVSKHFDKDNGFVYPFMDSSTLTNHIKGYSKLVNFNSRGIKVSESGDAGKSILIEGPHFIGRPAYVLTSKEFSNEYVSSFLNEFIPKFKQTSVISNVMYGQIENEYIEIPTNHKELSVIIKRILEYKQLSKQLKDYKISILQESEKQIKYWKENNEHGKYLRFKIGDKFEAISGKGSFNKMKKEGLCADEYNKEDGFIYPFYDGSTLKDHIKGYSKEYNFENSAIKVAKDGAESGKCKLTIGKIYNGGHSYLLTSNNLVNHYTTNLFSNLLPKFQQGTSIPSVKFSDYKDKYIEIPTNHKELSVIFKQINKWEELINKTTKKMETYIDEVLQFSLGKGKTNE